MKVAIPEKITVEMTEEEREALKKVRKMLDDTFREIFNFSVREGYRYFKCYDEDTDSYYTIDIGNFDRVALAIKEILEIEELVKYKENHSSLELK